MNSPPAVRRPLHTTQCTRVARDRTRAWSVPVTIAVAPIYLLDAKWGVPWVSISIGLLSLGIWLYLVFARGGFWHVRAFDDDFVEHAMLNEWPSVVAIVPARNEAETIGQAVAALLQQDYPGEFSIIVVDDHSDDRTSEIAQRTARENNAEMRVRIHAAADLPAGWTGKLWALTEGTSVASSAVSASSRAGLPATAGLRGQPERGICFPPITDQNAGENLAAYFWFTDGDVVHAPDTLHRLVARAEGDKFELVSLMVLLQARTLPERALIPAFLFFFLKLYPPRWTVDPQSRTAGAAGGCVLLRRQALDRMGGLAAIRGEVIDDCALARAVKRSGEGIWMGLTRASVSLRTYSSFGEIRDLIARLAFTQLHYSAVLLVAAVTGMFLTYLAPVILLFAHGWAPRILGLAAWLLMWVSFLPTVRFYRVSPVWAPLLPFVGAFYSYATMVSAVRYWLGRGAQWKGRAQAQRST